MYFKTTIVIPLAHRICGVRTNGIHMSAAKPLSFLDTRCLSSLTLAAGMTSVVRGK